MPDGQLPQTPCVRASMAPTASTISTPWSPPPPSWVDAGDPRRQALPDVQAGRLGEVGDRIVGRNSPFFRGVLRRGWVWAADVRWPEPAAAQYGASAGRLLTPYDRFTQSPCARRSSSPRFERVDHVLSLAQRRHSRRRRCAQMPGWACAGAAGSLISSPMGAAMAVSVSGQASGDAHATFDRPAAGAGRKPRARASGRARRRGIGPKGAQPTRATSGGSRSWTRPNAPSDAKSYGPAVYPKFMAGRRPARHQARRAADRLFRPGRGRRLDHRRYAEPQALFRAARQEGLQYPISVGRDGFTWSGTERISRIAEWPSWTPPPEMHKRVPGLPITVTGGLKNPQGARALYLGSTIYRIHGTNNDRTVGRANSSGCFRLTNEHVVHLASIAKVGTKVKVLQAYNGRRQPERAAVVAVQLRRAQSRPRRRRRRNRRSRLRRKRLPRQRRGRGQNRGWRMKALQVERIAFPVSR